MQARHILLLLLGLSFLSACREETEPERVAETFLSAYVDFRFSDAESLSAEGVQGILQWRASQLTQAELEMVADEEPQVETCEVESYGDSVVVDLEARNVLLLDSIGLPGHVGEQRYRVVLKKNEDRNWKVTALVEL